LPIEAAMMMCMGTAPDDDEFELIRRSGITLRVGTLSLSAGTGSYRVKASMTRIARALGVDRHQAHVTLTEITTTSHRGRSFRTEVAEVRSIGINAHRLAELERLARSVEQEHVATGQEAEPARLAQRIEAIADRPPLYSGLPNALWAAIACAAFAFLNNGGPVEIVGVFLAAGLGQAVRRAGLRRGWNQFGATMLSAATASLSYLGFVIALQALGATAARHEAGYISAVLFLIPGFAMVTGALDLAKLDFSAGVARLTYATMILTSAALAVWAVSISVGLRPDPAPPLGLPFAAELALRFAASFAGVLGFALLFNSPWPMAVGAACIGMVANVGRLELVELGVPIQAAAAAAALLVGLLAAVVAPSLDVPRITVSVPAVVIMVPGATAYRAIYDVSTGDTVAALAFAVQATLVIAALAVGLAVSRMLTDQTWGFEH
jgi:uncharacterized membrane protein YjjP (DUF1212 family)